MYQVGLIVLYLIAIVAANLSIATFGPDAAIVNAFLLIGLDLTTRDKLHEAWNKSGLAWKMALLIASGSLLSWWLDKDAGQIALASFVAFAASGASDFVMYQLLHKHPWLIKSNGSNLVSAAVDSLIFPSIVFGGIMPWITLGQFVAKVAGGAVWSYVLSFRPQPVRAK